MRIHMVVLVTAILALVVLPYLLVSLALPSLSPSSPSRGADESDPVFPERYPFLDPRQQATGTGALQSPYPEELRPFYDLDTIQLHPPFGRTLVLAVILLLLGLATGVILLMAALIHWDP
jgi:hypothetical protein